MNDFQNRFFYRSLSDREKQLYRLLLDGLPKRQTKYRFNVCGLDFERTWDALYQDSPELYFVKNYYEISYNSSQFSFTNPDLFSFSPLEQREIDEKLEQILRQLDVHDSAFEKELAVHNYIVHTCKYDWAHDTRGTQSAIHTKNHCLVGPLIDGLGVCEGFAKAAQYLLLRLGVPTVFYTGCTWQTPQERPKPGAPDGHAWVAVCIDEKWYHLDISHDVCLTHPQNQAPSDTVRVPLYCYFNVSDEEILQDHSFDVKKYSGIQCTSYLYNYYQKYKRFYHNSQQIKNAIVQYFSVPAQSAKTKRFAFRVGAHMDREAVLELIEEACKTVAHKKRKISHSVNVFLIELTF